MFLVGRSYKPKLKPAGPRINLYQHQTAFFYMHERVMHENHPNTRNLQQQSFNTPFTMYMTHLPSLVEFCDLVSEYWYCRIQTLVSPLKHRKLFFIAYRKLTSNYAKAFITLLSPRVLLGLVLNLLEE